MGPIAGTELRRNAADVSFDSVYASIASAECVDVSFKRLSGSSAERREICDGARPPYFELILFVRRNAAMRLGMIGYALLQALIVIPSLPWLAQADITPTWWSFSFGAASHNQMGIRQRVTTAICKPAFSF
jgi:hypothetical protein